MENGSKAADIRREIELEIEELAHETDRARKDERVRSYLEFCSRFHHYSAQNTWWLGWQCLDRGMSPTRFAGMKTWNKMNRLVRKGSAAFKVLKPCQGQRIVKKKVQETYQDPETGQQVSREDDQEETVPTTYFIPVNVFDVSQTVVMEGKEDGYIPQEMAYGARGDASRILPLVRSFAETVAPVTEVGKDELGEALGCTDGTTIKVLATLKPAVKCETLLHESAHVLLKHRHSDLGKATRECEAASVAYIVSKRLGLNPGGALYLALWDQEPRHIMAAMDRVLKVTETILETISMIAGGEEDAEQGEDAGKTVEADVLSQAMAEITSRRTAAGKDSDDAYKRMVAVNEALEEILNEDAPAVGETAASTNSAPEERADKVKDPVKGISDLCMILGISDELKHKLLVLFDSDLLSLKHLLDYLLKESEDSKSAGNIIRSMDELGYSPEFQLQLAYSRLGQIPELERELFETLEIMHNRSESAPAAKLHLCMLCGRELPNSEFSKEPDGQNDACNDCWSNCADFYEPCATCLGHPCRDYPCLEWKEVEEKNLVPDPMVTRKRILEAARDGKEPVSFLVLMGIGQVADESPAFQYTPEMMEALADMVGGFYNEKTGAIEWPAHDEDKEHASYDPDDGYASCELDEEGNPINGVDPDSQNSLEEEPGPGNFYSSLIGSVTIGANELKSLVDQVDRFKASRSIMTVLEGIVFKADSGVLELSATDLESFGVIRANVETEGRIHCLFPARELKDILKRLKKANITVSQDREMLTLADGKVQVQIDSLPIEDYPYSPEHDRKFIRFFEHTNKEFREVMDKMFVAASKDTKRPVLEGVYCQYGETTSTFVSTDSFRLAAIDVDGSCSGQGHNVLVPSSAMGKILKLKDKSADVEVSVDEGETHLRYTIGQTTVFVRLIEGKFPEWDRLIPGFTSPPCSTFKIDREDIMEAVDTVEVAGETVVFNREGSELTITANRRENNMTASTCVQVEDLKELILEPETSEDEPVCPGTEAAFKACFLKDGFGMMEENFSMRIENADKPMIMRSGDVQYLIMPVKL